MKIALAVVQKYELLTSFSHLDSSSFSVHGSYLTNELTPLLLEEEKSEKPVSITITKGYSRDHRPDLKQFIIDLIVSEDGGVPLFLRVADGNEHDKAVFGEIAVKYKEQQAPERGFGFLKDPLFFADSVFLKYPQRVETMAMLMGLCLLVYSRLTKRITSSIKGIEYWIKKSNKSINKNSNFKMDIPMFSRGSSLLFIGSKTNCQSYRRMPINFKFCSYLFPKILDLIGVRYNSFVKINFSGIK